MNEFAKDELSHHAQRQGRSRKDACALALVLKVRGIAKSTGLHIMYQECNEEAIWFLLRSPYMVLKTGETKTAFEELLSLAEMVATVSRKDQVELLVQFNLIKLADDGQCAIQTSNME